METEALVQLLERVSQIGIGSMIVFAVILGLFIFGAVSRAGNKSATKQSDILVKFSEMIGDGQKERNNLESRSTELAHQLITLTEQMKTMTEQMKTMLEQQIAALQDFTRVQQQFIAPIAEIPKLVPQAAKLHEETRALFKGYAAGVETHMDEITDNGNKLMTIIQTIQADLATIKNKVDATDSAVLTTLEVIRTQLDELVRKAAPKSTGENPAVTPEEGKPE